VCKNCAVIEKDNESKAGHRKIQNNFKITLITRKKKK
jgi:hypothetical protein